MSQFKFSDFHIGDILEFEDWVFKDKSWRKESGTCVDRISSLVHNVGENMDVGPHEFEIWFENYGEGPGRMFVTPEWVVRTVEKCKAPICYAPMELAFQIGQHVVFTDKSNGESREFLDIVSGYSITYDEEKIVFQYVMKYAKYHMYGEKLKAIECQKVK